MEREIFKSDRYFTIFDLQISHSQFLLRSQKGDTLPYNIDIIFFNTEYIQMCHGFEGITIKQIDNPGIIKYDSVQKYLSYPNSHVFKVLTGAEAYYVAASFVHIYQNELEFNETSLGFDNKGRENRIATSI